MIYKRHPTVDPQAPHLDPHATHLDPQAPHLDQGGEKRATGLEINAGIHNLLSFDLVSNLRTAGEGVGTLERAAWAAWELPTTGVQASGIQGSAFRDTSTPTLGSVNVPPFPQSSALASCILFQQSAATSSPQGSQSDCGQTLQKQEMDRGRRYQPVWDRAVKHHVCT